MALRSLAGALVRCYILHRAITVHYYNVTVDCCELRICLFINIFYILLSISVLKKPRLSGCLTPVVDSILNVNYIVLCFGKTKRGIEFCYLARNVGKLGLEKWETEYIDTSDTMEKLTGALSVKKL